MSANAQVVPENEATDLTTCDREPIHIPGSIQPHGVLLVLAEQPPVVVQASANAGELLGRGGQAVAGATLTELLGARQAATLEAALGQASLEASPLYLRTVSVATAAGSRSFHAIAHRFAGALVLELEASGAGSDVSFQDLYPLVRTFMSRLQSTRTIEVLAQLAAEEVRRITGFGRVLVYRFDPQWHGHVIAESREEFYPSYLGLWFPASDIPQQARTLYELNRLRLIADVNYRPVPILPAVNPVTGGPLDLTFAGLRSVSPIHIEYLKNMEVAASMSISVLTEEGRLWGLISCHDRRPRVVPFEVRTACDFLAQAFSVQLGASEQRVAYEQRLRLKSIVTQLLAFMAQEDSFIDGLIKHPDELLQFGSAEGAAVLYEGRCTLLGATPDEEAVWQLVQWLVERGREEVYHSDCLPAAAPNGEVYRERASGVLAISISKLYGSYVLWFRPEVVQTVTWSGNPQKAVETEADGSLRLHPRKSFEAWKETVSGRSLPWQTAEIEAAGELRNAVIGVVLRKAEELAQVSAKLQRSNKELEAFSYSVSHDLRAPFRHIIGYSELLRESSTAQLGPNDRRYVNTIIESAQFAGILVDNLLSFSQIGRASLVIRQVNMSQLVAAVRRELEFEVKDRRVEWRIGELPQVEGDAMMLRLVWQNLISNAIKYTRSRELAVVEVEGDRRERETVFLVRDNGVGFDPEYAHKLFGVFQRLHRMEDFEGTGIGLANVRRITARHGGRTWAEGAVNEGATFFFALPHHVRPEED